jgi:hypothetical protein
MLLFEQNNEKTTRTSIKATVVGTAKVLSYEDIVEAQQKRDIKEEEAVAVRGRRVSKRNKSTPSQVLGKRSRSRASVQWQGPQSLAKSASALEHSQNFNSATLPMSLD